MLKIHYSELQIGSEHTVIVANFLFLTLFFSLQILQMCIHNWYVDPIPNTTHPIPCMMGMAPTEQILRSTAQSVNPSLLHSTVCITFRLRFLLQQNSPYMEKQE